MDCDICFTKINKLNKQVNCFHCQKNSCKNCITKWIAEKNIVTCLHCNKEWDIVFIFDNLGPSFVEHIIKVQKNVIIQQEKNFMIESQQFLKFESSYLENKNKYMDYFNMYNECKKTNHLLLKEKYTSLDIFENEKFTKCKLLEHINTQKQKYYSIFMAYYKTFLNGDMLYLENMNLVEKNKSSYPVCPCIDTRCKGHIFTNNFSCTVCNIVICKNCHELLNENHICKTENIESIKSIVKSTKPCPKCGCRINKIDGCFGKNTIIPLYNGSFKYVQDIIENDIVIGDDYKPRTVLKKFTGVDNLYKVTQKNGIEYVVNGRHSLALYANKNFTTLTIEQYNLLNDSQKRLLLGYKSLLDKFQTNEISVQFYKKGTYYGFMIDGNHKFLLSDSTVVKNCDQMYCTQCNTAFSWKTGTLETGRIHNPHYYEQIRNGTIQLNNDLNHNLVDNFDNVDEELLNQITNDVIYRFNSIPSYRTVIDHLTKIYTFYLHNMHVLNLNQNIEYNFKTNYFIRLLYLKNRVSEKYLIKKSYSKFKEIQIKNQYLNIIIDYINYTKKIIIDIVKLFMIINENINNNYEQLDNLIENNKEEFMKIKDHINVFKDMSNDCFRQINRIGSIYKNFNCIKLFRFFNYY